MAILTRQRILEELDRGTIVVDPLDPKHIGPNSIDLHLGNGPMKVYAMDNCPYLGVANPTQLLRPAPPVHVLDASADNQTWEVEIPPEGLVLLPGVLYLGSTLEYTETRGFVPYLDGRSSAGRLGLSVHITAGRGDVNFKGRWTCELTVIHPLRVYAGLRCMQITYHTIEGEPAEYTGRYMGDMGPTASRMHRGE